MGSEDLLFCGRELRALIRAYEPTIRQEVEGWERNKILAASESDLVGYLVDKYALDPPRLLRDAIYVESEGDVKIDVSRRFDYGMGDREGPYHVPGSYVTIGIPFEGDPDLFGFQASSLTSSPPRGTVSGSNVLVSFRDVKLDPQLIRREIDATVNQIERYLGWIKSDCDGWNVRLRPFAEQCVRDRKRRLLEQANMVSALGLPMKRRGDAPNTFAVPVTRRKKPVPLPVTPRESFKPEPALPDGEYDFILEVIDRLAQSIERSPNTFVHMKEEQIRDLLLVSLNGHYEGDATGETFNAQGKTDILIRADGRNVFIAECKFWEGPKAIHDAIDQILGYVTWRDTKAALLVFSKNVDFTNVLAQIATAIPAHSNFKQQLRKVSETHLRFLFRQRDKERDLHLAVLTFNIPKTARV